MPNISDGPFIQVACFCETVLEDKSGSLSVIRIIDTVTHSAQGPNPPAEMPAFSHQFKVVLMLKSGAAKGRFDLKVTPELPNGSTDKPIVVTAYFDGEERGQNIVVDIAYQFKMEGLYWFDVSIGETKLTSMPFRVKYNRVMTGTTPPILGH